MVRGFATLTRRVGTDVVLPDGRATRGLFDRSTKAKGFDRGESQVMASWPSVVLETVAGLGCGAELAVGGERFAVRDHEAEDDGELTRYHLEAL